MERMTRQGYNGEYQGARGNSCPLCRSGNRGGCNSLMKELQKIDFALYETILYLDAYPYNKEALEYYHSLVHQRELVVAELDGSGTPITAGGNVSHTSWDWISSPWPWELSAN